MREDQTVEYRDSIGGLVRGLLCDVRELVREELNLARVELREQAGRAKLAAAWLGMAAAALAIGGVFLLVAVATGLADVMNWPTWAGYFVVALVMCTAGAVGVATGRRQIQRVHASPTETLQSVKENTRWIAKRLTSERK